MYSRAEQRFQLLCTHEMMVANNMSRLILFQFNIVTHQYRRDKFISRRKD